MYQPGKRRSILKASRSGFPSTTIRPPSLFAANANRRATVATEQSLRPSNLSLCSLGKRRRSCSPIIACKTPRKSNISLMKLVSGLGLAFQDRKTEENVQSEGGADKVANDTKGDAAVVLPRQSTKDSTLREMSPKQSVDDVMNRRKAHMLEKDNASRKSDRDEMSEKREFIVEKGNVSTKGDREGEKSHIEQLERQLEKERRRVSIQEEMRNMREKQQEDHQRQREKDKMAAFENMLKKKDAERLEQEKKFQDMLEKKERENTSQRRESQRMLQQQARHMTQVMTQNEKPPQNKNDRNKDDENITDFAGNYQLLAVLNDKSRVAISCDKGFRIVDRNKEHVTTENTVTLEKRKKHKRYDIKFPPISNHQDIVDEVARYMPTIGRGMPFTIDSDEETKQEKKHKVFLVSEIDCETQNRTCSLFDDHIPERIQKKCQESVNFKAPIKFPELNKFVSRHAKDPFLMSKEADKCTCMHVDNKMKINNFDAEDAAMEYVAYLKQQEQEKCPTCNQSVKISQNDGILPTLPSKTQTKISKGKEYQKDSNPTYTCINQWKYGRPPTVDELLEIRQLGVRSNSSAEELIMYERELRKKYAKYLREASSSDDD